ncbi:SWIM zinc finger family protein [Bradyrhizobium sp. Arg314]
MEESVLGRMNSSLRRFDVAALRKLAGEKVFARGEAYHLNGHVEILSIDSWRALAQVAGSEEYRTEVTGRDFEIAGSCSCPAFGDTGFCKHMVAVALARNAENRRDGRGRDPTIPAVERPRYAGQLRLRSKRNLMKLLG